MLESFPQAQEEQNSSEISVEKQETEKEIGTLKKHVRKLRSLLIGLLMTSSVAATSSLEAKTPDAVPTDDTELVIGKGGGESTPLTQEQKNLDAQQENVLDTTQSIFNLIQSTKFSKDSLPSLRFMDEKTHYIGCGNIDAEKTHAITLKRLKIVTGNASIIFQTVQDYSLGIYHSGNEFEKVSNESSNYSAPELKDYCILSIRKSSGGEVYIFTKKGELKYHYTSTSAEQDVFLVSPVTNLVQVLSGNDAYKISGETKALSLEKQSLETGELARQLGVVRSHLIPTPAPNQSNSNNVAQR